jgi:hypothetical protein
MSFLRMGAATLLILVWAVVVLVATFGRNGGLIGLATAITPVMLAPAGWLFAGEYLRQRLNGRNGRTDD